SLSVPVEDVREVVGADELARVHAALAALPLPNLEEILEDHRALVAKRLKAAKAKVTRQLNDLSRQIAAAEDARHAHPCHLCERRKEHVNNQRHVAVLEKERTFVEGQLREELTAEEERIRGIISGIRNVLHRFNYLHRGYPTAKADLLADVFDTNGLVVCEMIDRGLVDSLAAPDLAEVFSWFAYDRDSRFANTFSLPNHLVLLRRRLEDLEHQVLATERANGLFISSGHNAGFYGATRAWCNGTPMVKIIEHIDLSEGDLVLTFNKTIDLMRQVREMLANVDPDRPLRETLARAERLVRRDIVEQSLTLGFLPIQVDDDDAAVGDEE
ncbi:MAG: DNA helicase, partial [Chloroflexi bacterium]